MSDFDQIVYLAIERYFAGRHAKRDALVSSWDPQKHLAKVIYQPEEQESGWLPVHTMSAGNGYGLMTGLTPGDQVEVTHQEGDFDDGAITSRVHSEQAPAPTVYSGEQLLLTPWGSKIYFAKDGSVTILDQSGASFKFDGSGNLTITTSGNVVFNAPNIALNGQVYLGGGIGSGVAAAKLGTIDTGGNADISDLATKVNVV